MFTMAWDALRRSGRSEKPRIRCGRLNNVISGEAQASGKRTTTPARSSVAPPPSQRRCATRRSAIFGSCPGSTNSSSFRRWCWPPVSSPRARQRASGCRRCSSSCWWAWPLARMGWAGSTSTTCRLPSWSATSRSRSSCSMAGCERRSRPSGWAFGRHWRSPRWAWCSPRCWLGPSAPGRSGWTGGSGCYWAPSSVRPMRRRSSRCCAQAACGSTTGLRQRSRSSRASTTRWRSSSRSP